ncbi:MULTISPECIES: response regulator transcription factor [unclassified Saccharopolyspora]|uniref:response regulator n=1 Tax=unclassified Saccharopolyspora TaxID=2646250 RepID=UPI001CD6E209|nr:MULTISPECIES: response regulator transcription factor [unclassified Saccharopolyspora]MCA1186715.1 response regulator transcription factor [Saccharopolyspora sp. 6T]MCA1194598.1 response regulator transcription factor [Saccharopolyspora sp. 6V]MCA1226623.1 response regulator transcription factor [Saccharopolyspora sp. 6M]MCA1278344.1 response regulator transcription factor [Saccharopolyspora sp. 7B]
MIRFCVVDDHEIVHDGLRAMADREPDLEFVGAVASASEAQELVEGERPDVLLLDMRLGSGNSIDTCAVLSAAFPDLKIAVFSAYGNAELLERAIRAGAAGYVLKETTTARLPGIIRELSTSGSYFEPRLASGLLKRSAGPEQPAFNDRELEIVRMIARGMDNHRIGEEVCISPHTVKFHVTAMLRRHKVRRRTELVRVAMDLHLIDDS